LLLLQQLLLTLLRWARRSEGCRPALLLHHHLLRQQPVQAEQQHLPQLRCQQDLQEWQHQRW
jgi:hypothetical protein